MATQSTIRPGRRFSSSGAAGTVPLNFSQTKGVQVTITAAVAKPATVVSVTITTQGNPVQIIVSGDANPLSAGAWGLLNLYRDATAIGQQVQFESSAGNENVPYSLQVVDEPVAGTWTYSLKVVSVTSDTQFGESAGPIITATELGGVGSAVPSGAASGDLGGSYPGPDVIAIQGYSVSSTAPGAGEALIWDGSNWAPTAVSAGAGGNDTNIQYNSGGTLAGTNNFVFDNGSNRVSLTDGSQAIDIYPNLIEYVGPGSLLIDSNTTIDIGTLSSTGVNLGGAGVATTVAGVFTLPTADGAAGEVLTTDGAGSVSWQAGGVSAAAGGANEIQYNDGSNAFAASSNLTFDSTTNDLVVGSAALGHSIRIGPVGYVSNPIIESLYSMNINIADFGGALGIQAANNDLVLIGGDDGSGESYLQTQNNVRLETKGRLLVQPATDSGTAVVVKQSGGTTLLEVDTTTPQIIAYTRISSQGGGAGLDINPYSIEYVGGAGFLLDSDSGLNLGTTTSNGVAIGSATAALTISGAFTLPTTDGVAGETLTTDGAGNVSWQSPQVLQSIYVAEGADTAKANGSPDFPYATISTAMSAIIDASPTKRYAIHVAGGAYNEGASLNIKPNVFIVGAASGAVRITATTFGMDTGFSAGSGVDNRSGYQNVILIGACVFDWSAVTSSAGKLYFTSVAFNSTVTMTGYNNTIAQAQFTSCQFFGAFTNSGINVGVFANNIVFSDIVLNQHPSLATVLQATGGYCSGTLTATTTINTFARRISIFARSFWMGAVTVDGPQTYLDYTVDSLPAAGATVLNGATLVSIDTGTGADKNLSNLNFPTAVNNPIIPAATNATNFGDWGFQWFWSFAYLHASTGTDCYLISYPSAFGAETGPGKNVYVYADGAGLAADVSGGIVGLYTSNATGTGSSGLIEAETGSSVNGDSGDIRFKTGTPSGSGRRGSVIINSPLNHPYGTIAVAAPTAAALRTNPTYLTSQAAITLPAMIAADDGLRIEIVTTVPSIVTPPSGAANQRTMTANGGSTWIWINSSADWLCISAI